jgi:hypothetical protein
MAWFSEKVHVTFIDEATGRIIKVADMAPDDLPESFQVDTTLHLGDIDWSVVRAIPVTRAESSQSKKLKLYVRKVEKMDPSKILFSMPSICDLIPPLGSGLVAANDYALHEDDWRQLELVSHELASEVDNEIQSIRQIHLLHSAKIGWRKIHVRSRPVTPVTGRVTLRDAARVFGLASGFFGVTYSQSAVQINSGYSFTALDGQQFYGLTADGAVTVFAVARESLPVAPLRSIEFVEALAREFNLDLVRWCGCERVGASDPRFREILEENAS